MKKRLEFVHLGYKPKDDLVCLFRITPNKTSVKEAANTVALESSIGTWTKVGTKKAYVNKLAAKVFSIRGDKVKIAYPSGLFEGGNAPNILSSIAGNVFGMKALKGLRLEDVSFPKSLLKSFLGPRYGIAGVRKILRVRKRPLVGTIVKPKLGLKTKDHVKVAYDAWVGGCDIVKDDENLASQKFNKFKDRIKATLKARDKAERETGERKVYLPNVTAETKEMMRRTDFVASCSGRYVMHDILTAGFASLQTLRENTKLAIHAHRAMHGAFTENPKQGIAMMVIADFARLIGVDSLHIGTGIGKMRGGVAEVKEIKDEIESKEVKETKIRLKQKWGKIKPVMAVCSGGIYPGHVSYLVKNFGNDIVIQAGGGIHGHPSGTVAGARAMRQAVEGQAGKELREALKFWGRVRF